MLQNASQPGGFFVLMSNERLKIALPTGQLESGVLSFSRALGLDFDENSRKYLIEVRNMPLDFVILRASDVPGFVFNERSQVKAGITGSDILWEAGYGQNAGTPLIIDEKETSKPALFVGVSQELARNIEAEAGRIPTVSDLIGESLATKFPRIASDYLIGKQVVGVDILPVTGKTEAMQYVYWDCRGILDVVESGRTRDANEILELERFHEVTVRMIEAADKLSSIEKGILEDLREKIWLRHQVLGGMSA